MARAPSACPRSELKLASGMTATTLLKDLADVIELIELLHMPAEFAKGLALYVQAKYDELWRAVRDAPPDPHAD